MANHHDRGFPLLIGVCGHRNLDPDSAADLANAVTTQLLQLAAALNFTDICVISGMAAGTDLIVARAAIEAGVRVDALLPMPLSQYRADFDPDSLRELETLLAHPLVRCVELTPSEHLDHQAGRDKSYLALGGALARRSSLLLAVWDGQFPRLPGGTADTLLRYLECHTSEDGEFSEPAFIPAGAEAVLGDTIVYWVPVRRVDAPAHTESKKACFLTGAGQNRLAVHAELPRSILDEWRDLDHFNREYQALAARRGRLAQSSLLSTVPTDLSLPDIELLHDIDSRYRIADYLAMHYQRGSDGLFRLFGVLTLLMGGTYLSYELLTDSRWLLVAYLAVLLLSLMLFRALGRRHWFSSHLACRTLAESLRVKFYLALAGADHLVDTRELIALSGIHTFLRFGWIRHVLRSVERTDALGSSQMGNCLATQAAVERAWINDQHAYFTRKVAQLAHSQDRVRHYKRMMFGIILIVVLALVLFGETLKHLNIGILVPIKDLMMFVWGGLAVVLGAWELHQNKMATSELLWQYGNQLNHFARARAQLKATAGMAGRLRVIADLGRDSLMESYLWAIHRFHREHQAPSGH
jgi:hypothetical protein